MHVVNRVMRLAAVVLFALSFTVVRVNLDPVAAILRTPPADDTAGGNAEANGWLEATRAGLRNLINPPPPAPAANAGAPVRGRAPIRVATATLEPDQLGKDGIPGLILQPVKKTAQ